MTERPQARPARRPRRSRSLFAPDDLVNLSELSLAPEDYIAFSAGHTIAQLHQYGLIHGDLHGGHMLFDGYTGSTGVIDLASSSLTDVDPDHMFQDIAMVRMTMGEPWTRGFLAGYTRTSRMLIDREYPGYTDAVLARAGGRTGSVAAPAQPVFAEEELTALLAPVLDMGSGFPRLTVDLPDGVLPPEDLAVVRCALLMAEAGGAERLLAASPPGGILGRLTAALAGQARGEGPPGLLVPRPAVLRVFDREPEDPAVLRCLAGMTDVYDWLALRLDGLAAAPDEAAFVNSVRAAQLSLIVLQHGAWPVSALETEELKVTSRHRYLSWYAPMLRARAGADDYFHLLTYLVSRISLYERMFADPSQEALDPFRATAEPRVTNRLWSANWRALRLSRTALYRYLSALRDGAFAELPKKFVMEAARILALKNGRVVRATLFASVEVHGPMILMPALMDVAERYVLLAEEMQEAGRLAERIKARPAGLNRLARSEQVAAVLARGAPDGEDFDELVVRSLDPDFRI